MSTNEERPNAAKAEGPDGAEQQGARAKEVSPGAAADEGDVSQVEAAEKVDDPLAEARAEVGRIRDQLLRTAADYDNFRKRTRRELEDAQKRGREDLLRELLPVFDNLERAVEAAHKSDESGPLVQGVDMVLTQFLDLLKRHGITPIEVKQGQTFDPNFHQAVMQQQTKDVPPGMIAQVFQRGFMLHERVLRPANVAVSVSTS